MAAGPGVGEGGRRIRQRYVRMVKGFFKTANNLGKECCREVSFLVCGRRASRPQSSVAAWGGEGEIAREGKRSLVHVLGHSGSSERKGEK